MKKTSYNKKTQRRVPKVSLYWLVIPEYVKSPFLQLRTVFELMFYHTLYGVFV